MEFFTRFSHPSTQWDAVSTWYSEINTPPQYCPLLASLKKSIYFKCKLIRVEFLALETRNKSLRSALCPQQSRHPRPSFRIRSSSTHNSWNLLLTHTTLSTTNKWRLWIRRCWWRCRNICGPCRSLGRRWCIAFRATHARISTLNDAGVIQIRKKVIFERVQDTVLYMAASSRLV